MQEPDRNVASKVGLGERGYDEPATRASGPAVHSWRICCTYARAGAPATETSAVPLQLHKDCHVNLNCHVDSMASKAEAPAAKASVVVHLLTVMGQRPPMGVSPSRI